MKAKQPNKRQSSRPRAKREKKPPTIIAYSAAQSAKNTASQVRSWTSKVGVNEVARRAGLTPMTVSRFVSGDARVYFDVLSLIAEAVGYRLTLELIPEEQLRTALVQKLLPLRA